MPKIYGAKNLSADDMPSGIDAAKIGAGSVSNTEFSYLTGVTSAIQTQLTAKAPASGPTFTGYAYLSSGNYQLSSNAGMLNGDTNAGSVSIGGGQSFSSVNGGYVTLYGNSHASQPGDAHYYCGSASGAAHSFFDKNGVERQRTQEDGVACISPVVSVGTSFTTLCAVTGSQALLIATVTGTGSILLEWDGSTLTKMAGVATLVVAGSAGTGETAFRVSGGNLQAIVDTGTRNVSSGFSVRH